MLPATARPPATALPEAGAPRAFFALREADRPGHVVHRLPHELLAAIGSAHRRP